MNKLVALAYLISALCLGALTVRLIDTSKIRNLQTGGVNPSAESRFSSKTSRAASTTKDRELRSGQAPSALPQPRNDFDRAMSDQKVTRGATKLERATHRIEVNYAAFLKRLEEAGFDTANLRAALIEREVITFDAIASAREAGVQFGTEESTRPVYDLISQLRNEQTERIRDALGESRYREFTTFQERIPERTVATEIARRLSLAGSTLTARQIEDVTDALFATKNPSGRREVVTLGDRTGAGGILFVRIVPDSGLDAISTLLNPHQMEIAQAVVQEHRAQRPLH